MDLWFWPTLISRHSADNTASDAWLAAQSRKSLFSPCWYCYSFSPCLIFVQMQKTLGWQCQSKADLNNFRFYQTMFVFWEYNQIYFEMKIIGSFASLVGMCKKCYARQHVNSSRCVRVQTEDLRQCESMQEPAFSMPHILRNIFPACTFQCVLQSLLIRICDHVKVHTCSGHCTHTTEKRQKSAGHSVCLFLYKHTWTHTADFPWEGEVLKRVDVQGTKW